MNFFETLQLSIKAILANRLRAFLTILGIVIGVTSVILLIALVSGLKSFITEQISALGPNVMYVVPGKIGGGQGPGGAQINRLTLQDVENLKQKLGTEAEVSAGIQKSTTIKYKNKLDKNANVYGAQANYTKIISSLKIEQGRFFTKSEEDSGRKVAIVGPSIAKNLTNGRSLLGEQIIIGNGRYQVIGVLAARGANLGLDLDNIAIIPLRAAQREFGDDKVQNILVSANTPGNVKVVQKKVQEILGKRLSEDDFTVQTQEQTLSTVSQITGVLTIALGGIAAISLIVGGIGIMNIMLVSVTERTREIGLRKALGARPVDIRNQFLIEALTLSGLGGVIGIALGILLALIAGIFIKTTVPLWSVGLSFGFSILVGVVFGVAPAIRAARLNPIQALRYE
jgi:putative ABC transport system permease protein